MADACYGPTPARVLAVRQSLQFGTTRSQSTGTAHLLSTLVPSLRLPDHYVCPVPSCNLEEPPHLLATHLLAHHFGAVKTAACVLGRLAAACRQQGSCAVSGREHDHLLTHSKRGGRWPPSGPSPCNSILAPLPPQTVVSNCPPPSCHA